VGQHVDLDNEFYTIIGVPPHEFSFAPGNAEFWVPINSLSPHEKMRTFYSFSGIGRLRDGVALQTARTEMKGIASQLQQQYGITGRDLSASIVPLSEIGVAPPNISFGPMTRAGGLHAESPYAFLSPQRSGLRQVLALFYSRWSCGVD
jgi:hypothetical protein